MVTMSPCLSKATVTLYEDVTDFFVAEQDREVVGCGALHVMWEDLAEVRNLEAQQVRTLTDAGFTPESVIDAVTTGDFNLLKHTGLYSVQLQPPMPDAPPQLAPVDQKQIPAEVPKREALLLELARSMSYFASLKLGEPAPQRRRRKTERIGHGHGSAPIAVMQTKFTVKH